MNEKLTMLLMNKKLTGLCYLSSSQPYMLSARVSACTVKPLHEDYGTLRNREISFETGVQQSTLKLCYSILLF